MVTQRSSSDFLWQVARLCLVGFTLGLMFGGLPTFLFMAGWWWGSRDAREIGGLR